MFRLLNYATVKNLHWRNVLILPFCTDLYTGWNHFAIMVEAVPAQKSIFGTRIGIEFWQVHPFLPKNDRQERSSNRKEFCWEVCCTFFIDFLTRFHHPVIMIEAVLIPKNICNTICNWLCLTQPFICISEWEKERNLKIEINFNTENTVFLLPDFNQHVIITQ